MSSDTSLLNETVFGDLNRELVVTRKVLERCPAEHFAWKPHPKSMSLGQMAVHVADMPEWMRATIGQDELDSSSAPRQPPELKDVDQLLLRFEKNVVALREAVSHFDMGKL